MDLLRKVLQGFVGAIKWLINTKVLMGAWMVLLGMLIFMAVGAWVFGGGTEVEKLPTMAGSSLTPRLTNEGGQAAFLPVKGEGKADTSSRVKFIYVDRKGEPYPVTVAGASVEVLPDYWFSSDTCVTEDNVCYEVKFNPFLNRWKVKFWNTEFTVRERDVVYLPNTETSPPTSGWVNCPPNRRGELQLRLGYGRYWAANAVAAGLEWKYDVMPGWGVYSSVNGIYSFGDGKFVPRAEAGFNLKLK